MRSLALLAALCLAPALAHAEAAQRLPAASQLPAAFGELVKPDRISSTVQIVVLLTLVSLVPSILLMATCFTRVVIVLSLLRQAVGLPQLPPNPVLVGLALFTTLFVMAPVGKRIHDEALEPYSTRAIDEATALTRAEAPVRDFLLRQTREKDLALFQELSGEPAPAEPEQVGIWTLLPAFTISEMRTAFEIGFMVYLPFLVIDLVIASMLISMGMIVLPPIVISLPFKLMLFVLLDGWGLVVGGLVRGIR
jgi:flagellar biosynthetic protein FliP